MGEHSSLSLLRKLVRIITFLLLWQFGFTCNQNEELPCREANALQNVLDALGSPLASDINVTSSYCNDSNNPIKCKCLDIDNLCHITEIILTSRALSGYINEDVSELKSLERLELSSNRLYGTIPDSLGSLSNLTRLNLGGNQLTGPIPDSLRNLTNLIRLDLSNNQLSGTIPGSLGDLSTSLISLDLDSNQLTGPIPDNLKNLRNLTKLNLNMNFLTGNIPTSLGELSSLQILALSYNKLDGTIPDELGNLTNLDYLRLDENLLHGSLNPRLAELRNLRYFWLTSNNFTGELPQEYSNLKGLLSFQVSGNSLSGLIPSYIKNWVNLYELDLLGNNFEGPLPPEILNLTNLRYLKVSDLSNASFSLPANANWTISSLILRNCSVTGPIPSNFGFWRMLLYLDLSFNNLTGGIPLALNDTYINQMYLTGNMLSGVVPGWINDKAYKADLSYNNFTNVTLPEAKTNHTNLESNSTDVTSQKINIGLNRISIWNMSNDYCQDGKSKYHSLFINSGGEEANINGTLYEADENLSSSYVSDKRNWAYTCSGDFVSSSYNSSDYIKNLTCGVSVRDEALYKNARLCPVSLTYYGFCLQKGSYTVKLHFAEVVYTENADYSSLGKRVFDVYVQGTRVLKDFNIKEKAGGPNKERVEDITAHVKKDNLLAIHFFWAGKGSIYNPPLLNGPLISAISVTPNFKVGGVSAWKIAVIAVASILAALLLLALLWRMGLVGDRELRESRVQIRDKSYTVKQIIDATRKFSPKMKIGSGRFGIVYKAELPDQVVVAVKKLSPHSKQVIDQIRSEVYAQKKYRHENLVELLDGYSKKDLHLMIYEYMEHASLQDALFDSNSTSALSWEARYIISLGMAEGLKYLHENSSVIHRNIKPSNILLDGSLKAKISDFGLAKLYEEDNPYIIIGKNGTHYYMAPEYATRGDITDKVDVYSFGVVLLELISGKRNEEYRANQKAVFLVDRACVLHEEKKLLELVDKQLSQSETYNEGQAKEILNLAVRCVNISPTLRPPMSEVVSVLKRNASIFQNLNTGP